MSVFRGGLAQLGERLICIQEVAGSTPVSSTKQGINIDMKKIFTLLSLFLLTNCSMPLVSSLGGSAVTGVVSGKATHSAVSAGVDIMMYEQTGKTTKQHLFTKVFPDKDIDKSKTIVLYEDFKDKVIVASKQDDYFLMP